MMKKIKEREVVVVVVVVVRSHFDRYARGVSS